MTDLFSTVLRMSLTGSVVILAVLALRLCLRKAPRIFSYVLWSVVLVRLLCPVSFSAPVSVLGWVQGMVPNTVVETGEVSYLVNDAVDASEQVTDAANPQQTDANAVQNDTPTETINEATEKAADSTQTENSPADILSGLAVVWLIGMACTLGYGIFSMVRLRRRLLCSVREDGNFYLADDLDVPCVVGLVRPRIYLPSGMEPEERDCVLRHERHHIRRCDPVIRFLAYLALCVHWFNPLVWAAYVLSGRDMEISCDEAVLRQADGDMRAAYAAVLLNLSAGNRLVSVGALPFAEGNPKSRIRAIMNHRKPAFWVVIGAAVLCAAAIVCLAANPAQEAEESDMSQEAEQAMNEAVQEALQAEKAAQEEVQSQEALLEAEQTAIEKEEAEQAAIEEAETEARADGIFGEALSDGELSFDELIEMVKDENWNSLVAGTDINDWQGFTNFTEETENDAIFDWIIAEYWYNGRPYRVQVSCVPDAAETTADFLLPEGSVDAIYLYETDAGDALLLYSWDMEIQPDLDSFLSQSYDIYEAITMDIVVIPGAPMNAAVGLQDYKVDLFLGFDGCLFDFDPGIGHGESTQESWYSAGGIGVMNSGKNTEADEYDNQEFVYDADGKLTQVAILGNHMEGVYVESFATEDFTGLLYEYDFDLYTIPEMEEAGLDDTAETTAKFWVIFLDSGKDEPTYVVFFNEKCFSKDQAIAAAQTVRKK